jgi:hypothetical protein
MGMWSMFAFLLDGLLLGYYTENYVAVETRSRARCQVSGVRCQGLGARGKAEG